MGVGYNPRIVTDGLVLCLDAANPKSYPGSGTTWFDLSGNGNHVTLTNGPTFSNVNGGSIVFDGVNDYASIPVTSSFNFGTNSFSIDFWIKFNAFSGSPTLIVFRPYFTSTNNFLFYLTTSRNLSIYTNTLLNGARVLASNIIYNISLVKTLPDSISVYVDGINAFNATKPINVTGVTQIALLGDTQFNSDFSNANLSQTKIYNRALTATEIQQNFNATRGRYGI